MRHPVQAVLLLVTCLHSRLMVTSLHPVSKDPQVVSSLLLKVGHSLLRMLPLVQVVYTPTG